MMQKKCVKHPLTLPNNPNVGYLKCSKIKVIEHENILVSMILHTVTVNSYTVNI